MKQRARARETKRLLCDEIALRRIATLVVRKMVTKLLDRAFGLKGAA